YGLDQPDRAVDRRLFVLAPEHTRALIDLLERRRIFVELAGVRRAEQRRVDDRDFLDAAYGALELEFLALGEFTLPAALKLFRQDVEAPCDVGSGCSRVLWIAENPGIEHAENGRLFDDLPVVTAVQSGEHVANDAAVLDQRPQIHSRAVLARIEPQHRVFEPGLDEVVFERAFVLEILLGFPPRHLVER